MRVIISSKTLETNPRPLGVITHKIKTDAFIDVRTYNLSDSRFLCTMLFLWEEQDEH
jgi:hypothetical protein